MTRRTVMFINSDGKVYMTSEYNGDKSEFAMFGAGDSCEKDWADIMGEFRESLSLPVFIETDRRCQGYYHSCLGTSEYNPPKEACLSEFDGTDGVCVAAANPLPKEGMEQVIHFLKQHIADLADATTIIDMAERAYSKQILDEVLG